MVAPRQLCQHCWHNFAAPIGLVKLPHSEEIAPGKTTQTWLTAGDVGHQLINDTVPPLSTCNFAADELADLPVKLDQAAIHSLEGLLSGCLDQ